VLVFIHNLFLKLLDFYFAVVNALKVWWQAPGMSHRVMEGHGLALVLFLVGNLYLGLHRCPCNYGLPFWLVETHNDFVRLDILHCQLHACRLNRAGEQEVQLVGAPTFTELENARASWLPQHFSYYRVDFIGWRPLFVIFNINRLHAEHFKIKKI
jgi:hypothetical protein